MQAPAPARSRAARRSSPYRNRITEARMRRALQRLLHMGARDDASEGGSGENKKRLEILASNLYDR